MISTKKLFSVLLLMLALTIVFGQLEILALEFPEDAPFYDLEGREFRFSIDDYSLEEEHEDYDPQFANTVVPTLEEKFNTTINQIGIYGSGEAREEPIEELRNDLLAGDDTYHAMYMHAHEIPHLVRENLIRPIDHALEELDYFEEMPEIAQGWKELFQYQGQTYAVPATTLPHNVRIIFWNKDMFERENLPNLYELYEEGNWTWETFEEIADEVTRDTSGDGEIDQWGVSGEVDGVITNGQTFTKTENGRVVVNFDNEEVYRGIEFNIKQNQAEWAINTDTWRRFEEFNDGEVAMAAQSMWAIDGWGSPEWGELEDDWGVVPLPKGPDADQHYAQGHPSLSAFVFPISNDIVPESIAIIDTMYGYTGNFIEDIEAHWEEEVWYEYQRSFRDRESAQYARENLENFIVDHYSALLPEEFGEAMSDIYAGERSVGEALSAVQDVSQSALDEQLNQ